MASFKELIAKVFTPRQKSQPSKASPYSTFVDLFSEAISNSVRADMNATFASNALVFSQFLGSIKPTLFYKDAKDATRSGINYLLQLKPNALDTAPTMWMRFWKAVSLRNFGMIWIQRDWDGVTPTALWNIDPDSTRLDMGQDGQGRLWFRFQINGREISCDANDVIIVQRDCNVSDIIAPLSPALAQIFATVDTSYTGLDKAVKQSMMLRFLVQGATVYNDKDRTANEAAMNEILSGKNAAAYLSAGDKVTEVQNQGKWPLSPEIKTVEEKVNNYQGVSDAMARGDFSEIQCKAFVKRHQGLLDSLASELTAKLLSPAEYFKGNEIRIPSDNLVMLNSATLIELAKTKLAMPVVVTNDVRKTLGEEPIEGGDTPQVNLNFVKSAQQSSYQTGQPDPKPAEQTQGGNGNGNDPK